MSDFDNWLINQYSELSRYNPEEIEQAEREAEEQE